MPGDAIFRPQKCLNSFLARGPCWTPYQGFAPGPQGGLGGTHTPRRMAPWSLASWAFSPSTQISRLIPVLWRLFYLNCGTAKLTKWAASWQNQQSECAPSEDSDQPGHLPSLIRVFAVCMKKAWSRQRRLRSDWADAKADLSLCWVQAHFVGFVMSWLKCMCPVKTRISLTVIKWDRHEKTCLWGLQPGKTQTSLLNYRY